MRQSTFIEMKVAITAEDVARRAGVSQPTVSRAFDPDAPVAPETRARILAVAAQLGYQPNALARGLITRRSNIIGVVMANLAGSYFYPAVLERLTQRLQARGNQTLLFNLPADRPVDDLLPQLLAYQLDGLIIASTTPSAATVARTVAGGTPVVLFNRVAPGPHAHAVSCDAASAAALVANTLVAAGHTRLAVIAGPAATESSRQREAGFTAALQEAGVNLVRAEGPYTYQGGAAAARHLLRDPDRPDAIFCAADIMALGALDVARHELGLDVPGQLSVVGFDDIPPAAWPAYALTTVRQPLDQMVDDAIDLLATGPDSAADEAHGRHITHAGTLIRRRSARL